MNNMSFIGLLPFSPPIVQPPATTEQDRWPRRPLKARTASRLRPLQPMRERQGVGSRVARRREAPSRGGRGADLKPPMGALRGLTRHPSGACSDECHRGAGADSGMTEHGP